MLPALALAVNESRGDVMKNPPRDPKEPILTRYLWGVIGAYGALIALSVLAVFWYAFQIGLDAEEAVTIFVPDLRLRPALARLQHARSGLADHSIMKSPQTNMSGIAVATGVLLMLAAAYLPVLSRFLIPSPRAARRGC